MKRISILTIFFISLTLFTLGQSLTGKRYIPYLQTDTATVTGSIGTPVFRSGFLGEGWQIKDNDATFDNLTVRKSMNVYELLVKKIRAVNGGIVVSAANAKAKMVLDSTLELGHWVIYPEDSITTFQVNDIARVQNFSGNNVKYYSSVVDYVADDGSYFTLKESAFEGSGRPFVGDEIVQFGNTTDESRQGVIYITATDDGSPFIDILDKVNSYDFTGKNKVRIGNLSGITDDVFGSLSGYGFYTESGYIKSTLATEDGKMVSTQFSVMDGKIASKVNQTAFDILETSVSVVRDELTGVVDSIETVKGRLTTAESSIVQNANSITSKVSQSEFDVLEGSVGSLVTRVDNAESSITQQADQIASKVSSSTFDTFQTSNTNAINTAKSDAISTASTDATNKANTAKTEAIGEAATDATAKANTAENNAKGYTDTSIAPINSRLTTAESSIVQQADQIQSKVSQSTFDVFQTNNTTAINNAQTTATDAATAAANAQTSANTANAALNDISSDNKFIAVEKQNTKVVWDEIVKEYPTLVSQAGTYSVSTTDYTLKYDALNTYITPLMSDLTSTSDIDPITFRTNFSNYYDEKTKLLKSVSDAAKVYTDNTIVPINSRLTTAESSITQQADQIALKVNQTTYEAGLATKEGTITKATAAPSSPATGQLWMDTSVTPNILKRWSGSAWVKATPTTAGEVGAYSSSDGSALAGRVTSAETSITQQANSIALKASQTDVDALGTRMTTAEQKITPEAITSTVSGSITTAKNEAISTAAADATTKANSAQSNAISTASSDATTKANNAQSTAISTAATDATNKANAIKTDISNRLGVQLMPNTWTIGSGSVDIYSQNGLTTENVRVYGTNHLGQNVILWECRPSGDGNSDGGWNTSGLPIDNTKTYRFSVFMKTSANTGTSYLGAIANSVCDLNTTTVNSNPYFWNGDLPSDNKWYLIVGYIYPYNTTGNLNKGGIWNCETGEQVVGSITSFNWANVSASGHRCFHYYDNNTSTRQWMWNPRIDMADGNEPSIPEMLGIAETPYTAQAKANAAETAAKTYANNTFTTQSTFNSTVTQLNNSITSKVSQTDFNALGTRVGSAESTITQHTNNITFGFNRVGVDGYTRTGKTTIDANGLTVYDGGIKIKNNAGTDVLSADAGGNLSLTGTVNATAGSFTGSINAGSGTIGGFTISGSGIVNDNGQSYVICRNLSEGRDARIGSSVFPLAQSGVSYFQNTANNAYSTNYAVYAKASNSGTSGTAYAGYFDGNVNVTNGVITGSVIIPDSKVYHMPNSNNAYLPSGYYLYINDLYTQNLTSYLPSPASYAYGECIQIINWQGNDIQLKPISGMYINGWVASSGTNIRIYAVGDNVTLRASRVNSSSTNNCWMIVGFGGTTLGIN